MLGLESFNNGVNKTSGADSSTGADSSGSTWKEPEPESHLTNFKIILQSYSGADSRPGIITALSPTTQISSSSQQIMCPWVLLSPIIPKSKFTIVKSAVVRVSQITISGKLYSHAAFASPTPASSCCRSGSGSASSGQTAAPARRSAPAGRRAIQEGWKFVQIRWKYIILSP